VSKKDKSAKKTFASEEEFNDASFDIGVLRGMYICYDIAHEEIQRLRKSLEDVWAIEYSGVITPAKQAHIDKLIFAVDTLTTLDDMLEGSYFTKLDSLREKSGEDEWHGNPS
jgi:hypothetical protein